MMRYSAKVSRLSYNACLLAAALILSYIESLFPLSLIIPLPGVKLGLANIAVMFAFYHTGKLDAAIISLARISLISILFGSISGFWFSLLGGALAYAALWLFEAVRSVGRVGVSCASAAFHGIGQIIAACIFMSSTAVFSYLPILLAASVPLGIFTGALLIFLEDRIVRTLK